MSIKLNFYEMLGIHGKILLNICKSAEVHYGEDYMRGIYVLTDTPTSVTMTLTELLQLSKMSTLTLDKR